MKKRIQLWLGVIVLTHMIYAWSNNTEELMKQLKQEQALAEQQIIQLWQKGASQQEIDPILKEYVVREIRLRSLSPQGKTDTLLSAVLQNNPDSINSTQNLTQSLITEYLRRRGVFGKPYFVVGRYQIVLSAQK